MSVISALPSCVLAAKHGLSRTRCRVLAGQSALCGRFCSSGSLPFALEIYASPDEVRQHAESTRNGPHPVTQASSASSARGAPHKKPVLLTKKRHDALLDAEVVHFARALKAHPITLQQILALKDPTTYRKFLLEELPIRYARRLELLQSLPSWREYPNIRALRTLYADAFRRLRSVSHSDGPKFRSVLQNIKRRNANVLTHAVRGTRAMKEEVLADEQADHFLGEFLTQRIGTDILSSQYLAITRPSGATSVIDAQCNPVALVRTAAADAVRLCKFHYDSAPPIDIMDVGQVCFPFIPQYLYYIIFELLKNSLRAVTERYVTEEESHKHPVRVVICGDETTVVIRVSDMGGGIALDHMPKVWSYLYTTAKAMEYDRMASSEVDSDDSDDVAPMAGFGCGLPLSRNYATYAGGWLELNTMPHHGCDAYLYLNRIGDAQEVVAEALPCRGFLPPDDYSLRNAPRRATHARRALDRAIAFPAQEG